MNQLHAKARATVHLATAERGYEGETMTAKQKKFILNKLIPFILREEGRGFDMSESLRTIKSPYRHLSGNVVVNPTCGTVACIGGSVLALNGVMSCDSLHDADKYLGLTRNQAELLFFNWDCWPEPFAGKFENARTPLAQAKVAVALLKKVVRTNGKCLDAR